MTVGIHIRTYTYTYITVNKQLIDDCAEKINICTTPNKNFTSTKKHKMTLTSTISSVLRDVSSRNTKESLEEGLKILLRLLDNVISDPGNTKYRRIRSENKIIKEKLLSLDGMNDLLKEIGFVLGEDAYDLPTNVLIARLKEYRTEIDKAMSEKSESEGTGAVKKKKKGVERVPFRAGKSYKERTNFSKVINSPNQFLRQIESLSDEVMQYEDEVLQETGRSMMPLEKLKNKTMESLRKIQKSIKEGKSKDEPSYDDLFIWELAEWFKTDFFTWVNALPCPICKNEKTTPVGHTIEDGVRVEQYRCCNQILKFYRYNDVLKLLQTRKGRCGEWANCFTFLCRCLGYNARYIYSTEDHVWTEVYSTLQNRWIHVDPSDNVIDAPLMYEHGWKKEIRYIFAFSRDDVQDVTWRYTNQHKKVMEKRRNCTEKELLETILAVRKKRQEGFSELKLKNYMKRTLKELADLTVEREATEDEKRGRSSGSLEWRQARSESSASNSVSILF